MWTAAVLPGMRGCAVKIRDRKENGKKRGAEKGSFLFPLEGEAELLKVLTWSANEPGGEPLCPELPRFVDYFQDGKREYLVMEYLRGVTLGAYLRGGNVCPEEDILKLSIGLCGFLEKLHRHVPPILYLDLAPDNILLTPSGGFRITDLGAAAAWHWREKLAETILYGTPGYAAPEQYHGQPGPASDIYSLGILIHLLCSSEKTDSQHPSKCQHMLKDIVSTCTQKDPAQRYPDSLTLKRKLQAVLSDIR